MGLRHPKLIAFEKKLRKALREVDRLLEDQYGERYDLHPSRAKDGSTSNPAYDGLFQVSASFSAGYGSAHGRGYVVEIRMVTLENIPAGERAAIEADAVRMLDEELERIFPNRDLDIQRDGTTYKITGDLSLGST